MNKTRSGRQIKKPNYYEPDDTELIDDFKQDDYDSDIGSDIETDEECHSEDDENHVEDAGDESGPTHRT